MIRLVLFLLTVLALAAGLAWLADRPGTLLITWQDYEIETSVFRAVVILAALVGGLLVVWSLLRQLWSGPAIVSHYLTRRRRRRGLDALSAGMIAVGAGDRGAAARAALEARRSLPHEPLTHILRAQAAQLAGDRSTARRIYEAMLASPETELFGLRGLFLEAGQEKEHEVQRQLAARAHTLSPKLSWPVEALFDLECRAGDWESALKTLASERQHGHVQRTVADRRRAVLLTAQAQALEHRDAEKALKLALEAHALAPDLIPAAAIAGRVLAARGHTPRAAKVLQRTWVRAPHPDLATAYAYARIGDSPRDRLDRVKQLAALTPFSIEAAIAIATAAIEARNWDEARRALHPYLDEGLTRRVAVLMARIEAEERGDQGRVRSWLARAVHAHRDPAWTADSVVSDRWMPVSPTSGALDAFQWRVPVEEVEGERARVNGELDDLIALARTSEPAATDPAAATAIDVQAEEVEPTRPPAPAEVRAASEKSSRIAPATEKPADRPRTGEAAPAKPQAFTPTHAPDDPGTGAEDEDDLAGPLRPYRA